MYLVREIFYCKPGKVRPLIEKFKAMSALGEKSGMPPMRLMTDMAGERYWTLVAEMEVGSIHEFETMMQNPSSSVDDQKALEKIMDGYHELVVEGRREFFRIET